MTTICSVSCWPDRRVFKPCSNDQGKVSRRGKVYPRSRSGKPCGNERGNGSRPQRKCAERNAATERVTVENRAVTKLQALWPSRQTDCRYVLGHDSERRGRRGRCHPSSLGRDGNGIDATIPTTKPYCVSGCPAS